MQGDKGFRKAPPAARVGGKDIRLPEMLFGYLIGPFGAMLSSGIFASFLNKYLTDVLQMDTAFLSALQIISTVLIVAANLLVGQLIERTRSMAGKARPWILLSALTLSVAGLLMFIVPFRSETGKMIWIAVAYNLYYAVAYPIYNTANSTLVPVSTRDGKKRGVLASMTNIAGLGVMGVGSMLFPILVSQIIKNDQSMWFFVMLGVAVFSALTIYLQYRFTRERVTEERMRAGAADGAERRERIALKTQLAAVTGEKWWWIILLFYLLFQWSGAMKNGSMSYYCQWVLGASGTMDWGIAQTALAVVGAIPMAAAALFVVPLANRFSKRTIVLAGMLLGVAGGVTAGLGARNFVAVCVGIGLKCLGSAPAAYLILAMLADVIEHVEYKRGIRTDGLTMSIYSSVMVAATPVMNAVYMAFLGPAYDAAAAAQTASVQNVIVTSYIWIETLAFAVCAILIFFFTVEKRLPEEQKAIERS